GKHNFDLLSETWCLANVVRRYNAAAEQADVREQIEVLQRDVVGFCATHGEAGHCAVRLIGERAELGVDIRNQLVAKNSFKCGIGAKAGQSAAPTTRRG